MSLYRCAACGSAKVMPCTENGGLSYNYKKGAIGTVVLGTGGAVAGIQSNHKQVFKCPDCGLSLDYAMPDDVKLMIDFGVDHESSRQNLSYKGVPVSWSFFTQRYKNIEEGFADKQIAERNAEFMAHATATKDEFDKAVDLLVDFRRRLGLNYETPLDCFSDETPMSLMEFYAWQEAICLVVENMPKYLPDKLPEQYRGLERVTFHRIFYEYLYIKTKSVFGCDPIWQSFRNCKDMEAYATMNPFVLQFADMYYPQNLPNFNTKRTELVPWTAKEIPYLSRRKGFANNMLITHNYTFTGINNEEITVIVYVPRYTVENGRMRMCREAHHSRVQSVMTQYEYFKYYPEKQAEFDSKVSEHNMLLIERDSLNVKLKALKNEHNEICKKIKDNGEKINQLKNKIFGKKKAISESEALEKETELLQVKSEELMSEYQSKEARRDAVLSDEEFYYKLVQDMDCFTIWQYIDEAE